MGHQTPERMEGTPWPTPKPLKGPGIILLWATFLQSTTLIFPSSGQCPVPVFGKTLEKLNPKFGPNPFPKFNLSGNLPLGFSIPSLKVKMAFLVKAVPIHATRPDGCPPRMDPTNLFFGFP